MKREPRLTIGELAKRADVNVETIRYYERIGLVRQPPTPTRGWRRYGGEAVACVRFVRRAQKLGFSLAEIKLLLRLRASGSSRTCASVVKEAERKVEEIDAKVRDLRAMRKVLVELTRACPRDGAADRCPILRALEG